MMSQYIFLNMTQLYAAHKKLMCPIGRLKIKGQEKICHLNIYQSKSNLSILILNKVVFKTREITREREARYAMIKGQSNMKYAPNNRIAKYVKQKLTELEREIETPKFQWEVLTPHSQQITQRLNK